MTAGRLMFPPVVLRFCCCFYDPPQPATMFALCETDQRRRESRQERGKCLIKALREMDRPFISRKRDKRPNCLETRCQLRCTQNFIWDLPSVHLVFTDHLPISLYDSSLTLHLPSSIVFIIKKVQKVLSLCPALSL